MRLFTNKNATQKITIVLLIVILFNFLVPIRVQAGDIGGDLLKELVKLFVALGDIVNGIMNKFMLGTTKMYSSSILSITDQDLIANLNATRYI